MESYERAMKEYKSKIESAKQEVEKVIKDALPMKKVKKVVKAKVVKKAAKKTGKKAVKKTIKTD